MAVSITFEGLPKVELVQCNVKINKQNKRIVIYKFKFIIDDIQHICRTRYSHIKSFHDGLISHKLMNSWLKKKFPSKYVFKNMNIKENYTKRAQDLLIYLNAVSKDYNIINHKIYREFFNLNDQFISRIHNLNIREDNNDDFVVIESGAKVVL